MIHAKEPVKSDDLCIVENDDGIWAVAQRGDHTVQCKLPLFIKKAPENWKAVVLQEIAWKLKRKLDKLEKGLH